MKQMKILLLLITLGLLFLFVIPSAESSQVSLSEQSEALKHRNSRLESEEDEGLTVKLSAAWLIENAGIEKGFQIAGSGAAISSKHTLAIVNKDGATAQEILQLAEYVQVRVSNKFGINLQPEPNLIGFAKH